MQRTQISRWTKPTEAPRLAIVALLVGAATLGLGCSGLEEGNDIDVGDVEVRDQAQPETGGPELEEDDLVAPGDIPGHYIVMMKKGANAPAAAAAIAATPTHVYTQVFPGFAGPLNEGQLVALSHRKDVVLVEADQVVTAAVGECPNPTTQEKTGAPDHAPSYGVDRIDQRDLPFSNTYTYPGGGEAVNVYVFDTWLDKDHPDFGGRVDVDEYYDGYPNDPAVDEQCSGHATHVAGLIGGTKYGVAKDVNLFSVEVLDCSGHGSWSKLLAGIDWVLAHKGNTPAIANMSLAGRKSSIVNWAVNDLADSGVFVAVAAGNENRDACKYSPAGAANVMTAAANRSDDRRASFSNYGPCVDIYAGGSNIRSAWPGGGSATASGTSMSSPQVAGVAALYKQVLGDVDSDQLKADLEAWATPDRIIDNLANTPNLMLYWPCLAE